MSLSFLAVACSDSDGTPSDDSGAGKGGGGGRAGAGAGGRAGAGGANAGAGRGGSSGGASAGAGEAAGEGGTPSGEGGDSSAGALNGGIAGDDGVAGQGGAPATAACLPSGTTLQVTATNTASAYVIGGLPAAFSDGAGDHNAPLTLCRGYTYTLTLNVAGHPFYFKTARVTGAAQAYDTGVTGNGLTTGLLVFVVPAAAPSQLYYQCGVHAPMGGTVTIVDAG